METKKLLMFVVVLPIGLVTLRGLLQRWVTRQTNEQPETVAEHASLAAEHARTTAELATDSE